MTIHYHPNLAPALELKVRQSLSEAASHGDNPTKGTVIDADGNQHNWHLEYRCADTHEKLEHPAFSARRYTTIAFGENDTLQLDSQ